MKFRLTTTDSYGASDTTEARVIVRAPNIGPNADAGENQVVKHNTQVTLDGSNSQDYGVGYIRSYNWVHKSSIPDLSPIPTLSSNDEAIVTFTSNALNVGDNDIIHLFELTVTDDRGAQNTDLVQVTVKAPIPPNVIPIAKAYISINSRYI